MALSGLWALGVLACAQVTVDDPPSQLGNAPNSAGGGSAGAASGVASPPGGISPGGMTPGAITPANVSPGAAPTPAGSSSSAAGTSGAPSSSLPPSSEGPGALPAPPIATTGESGDVLFSDDFEDGNDAGWVADVADGDDLVGNWAVVATEEGQAYAQLDTSSSDESWSVGGSIEWTDVELSLRFRFTESDSIEDAIALIGVRFRDKDNYYYIEYGGDGELKLRKRVDGSEPDLSSVDLERTAVAGEWIALSFTARGSTLEARVDGELVGSSVVDADLTSGGIALGVRENAAVEFDDVQVTVP